MVRCVRLKKQCGMRKCLYIYVLHDATRAIGATFRLFQGLL